jgi:hypothetical protein
MKLVFFVTLLIHLVWACPGPLIHPDKCTPQWGIQLDHPTVKNGVKLDSCQSLIARCRCQHGIHMKWISTSNCVKDADEPAYGCQCANYCNLPCEKKCLNHGCKWLKNKQKCVNNDGVSHYRGKCNATITASPTWKPTKSPTTSSPTNSPSHTPTTSTPTETPSDAPVTETPTETPSEAPVTETPSDAPITNSPTEAPSTAPTLDPETSHPTQSPVEYEYEGTPVPTIL